MSILELIRNYCLSKSGVEEYYPFDEYTLCMKAGKIFALIATDTDPLRMNLKCDPERAIELRESYSSILPGYHMNKKHWNTIVIDGSLSEKLILELIDHSYDLIIKSLTKKERENILNKS